MAISFAIFIECSKLSLKAFLVSPSKRNPSKDICFSKLSKLFRVFSKSALIFNISFFEREPVA
ncbi:hypothetical protein ACRS99_001403 [Clostridium perfringens]